MIVIAITPITAWTKKSAIRGSYLYLMLAKYQWYKAETAPAIVPNNTASKG